MKSACHSLSNCKPSAARVLDERREEWHRKHVTYIYSLCQGFLRDPIETAMQPGLMPSRARWVSSRRSGSQSLAEQRSGATSILPSRTTSAFLSTPKNGWGLSLSSLPPQSPMRRCARSSSRPVLASSRLVMRHAADTGATCTTGPTAAGHSRRRAPSGRGSDFRRTRRGDRRGCADIRWSHDWPGSVWPRPGTK
jgi:hypothetical protein